LVDEIDEIPGFPICRLVAKLAQLAEVDTGLLGASANQ